MRSHVHASSTKFIACVFKFASHKKKKKKKKKKKNLYHVFLNFHKKKKKKKKSKQNHVSFFC